MAEEACSGIRSLFSSITAILFWGLMNRYHWFRNVLNVIQTMFWVIIFNSIRIMVVVWVEENTRFSVASGWRHDLLGLLVFFFIFGTTLSMNQLIGVFAPLPKDYDDDLDEVSVATNATTKPVIGAAWTESLRWNGSTRSAVFWCGVFGILSIASLRLSYLDVRYQYDGKATERALVKPEMGFLPSRVNEWQTVSFDHEQRGDGHNMGADSYIWKLVSDNGKVVLVSIDGVFDDYHELANCYDNLGWNVAREVFYGKDSEQAYDSEAVPLKLTRLNLTKQTGESGLVLFTAVDRNGGVVVPTPSKATDMVNLLNEKAVGTFRALVGKQSYSGSREAFFQPPVSTIQMIYQPNRAVTEEDATEVRSLFLQVREILRKSPRFVTTKSS
jgi:exosortase/archaeosortase family protein